MSKRKHAAGPWRLHPTDDTTVVAADGSEVAAIDGDYNDPDLWPIIEANARLIAAAPELVEALAETHSYLSEYRDELVDSSCIHDDDGRALRETTDSDTQPFVEEVETLLAKISALLDRIEGDAP